MVKMTTYIHTNMRIYKYVELVYIYTKRETLEAQIHTHTYIHTYIHKERG